MKLPEGARGIPESLKHVWRCALYGGGGGVVPRPPLLDAPLPGPVDDLLQLCSVFYPERRVCPQHEIRLLEVGRDYEDFPREIPEIPEIFRKFCEGEIYNRAVTDVSQFIFLRISESQIVYHQGEVGQQREDVLVPVLQQAQALREMVFRKGAQDQ